MSLASQFSLWWSCDHSMYVQCKITSSLSVSSLIESLRIGIKEVLYPFTTTLRCTFLRWEKKNWPVLEARLLYRMHLEFPPGTVKHSWYKDKLSEWNTDCILSTRYKTRIRLKNAAYILQAFTDGHKWCVERFNEVFLRTSVYSSPSIEPVVDILRAYCTRRIAIRNLSHNFHRRRNKIEWKPCELYENPWRFKIRSNKWNLITLMGPSG